MRLAILADLRANGSALLAVLDRLDRLQIDRIWFIGSLLSYGPDPVAVVDLVRSSRHADRCLLGHPDGLILDLQAKHGWNPSACRAFAWANERLLQPLPSATDAEGRRAWLADRPSEGCDGEWQFFSGTPLQPAADFLPVYGPRPNDDLAPHLAQIRRGAFVGTIGRPGIVFADTLAWQDIEGDAQRIVTAGRAFIACPGAVGQPRDEDPRAGFAVCDSETITWYRVPYDVSETMRRIGMQPALSARYAERLRLGR